jgi:hypothetical protein
MSNNGVVSRCHFPLYVGFIIRVTGDSFSDSTKKEIQKVMSFDEIRRTKDCSY